MQSANGLKPCHMLEDVKLQMKQLKLLALLQGWTAYLTLPSAILVQELVGVDRLELSNACVSDMCVTPTSPYSNAWWRH